MPGHSISVFDAVVDTVQVMREPAVHHFQWWQSSVSALVQVHLTGDAFRFQSFENMNRVAGHDVPVAQSVAQQRRGLVVVKFDPIVATGPEVVVVTGDAVLVAGH